MSVTQARQREITLLIKRGRLDSAEQLCQAELLQHPTDPHVWYYLGAVQSMGTRSNEALRSLKVAVSHAGQDEPLLLRIAQAMLRMRAYAPALAIFERMSSANPQVIFGQARCRWGLGQYNASLQQFAGLWEARPEWPELCLAYARALISVDQPEPAGTLLQQILQTHPREAQLVHQYTTWVLSQQGTKAAYDWLTERKADYDSPRLSLLRRALSSLHRQQPPAAISLADSRLQSHWDSFSVMMAMPGAVTWTGDNTASLKQAMAAAPANGLIVECGVYHGRSLRLLAQWSGRECHGFDSFQGLPEDWNESEPAGSYSTAGHQPQMPDNVTLHAGWFEESLPEFAAQLQEKIALLHVDCDLYSSTVTVLEHLMPHMAENGVIVFDDFAGYPEWRDHEYLAWRQYEKAHNISAELITAVLLGRSAAFRLK
ncbi:MAG: hypothetical protein Tsb002_17500 [Wenzhouxiangellaceae bacterium]